VGDFQTLGIAVETAGLVDARKGGGSLSQMTLKLPTASSTWLMR